MLESRCDYLTQRCDKKISKNFKLKDKVKEQEQIIKKEVDNGIRMRIQAVKEVTEQLEKRIQELTQ